MEHIDVLLEARAAQRTVDTIRKRGSVQSVCDAICQALDTRETANGAIDLLSDRRKRCVLRSYYLHRRSIPQIARDMDTTENAIWNLRIRGTREILEKLPNSKPIFSDEP